MAAAAAREGRAGGRARVACVCDGRVALTSTTHTLCVWVASVAAGVRE